MKSKKGSALIRKKALNDTSEECHAHLRDLISTPSRVVVEPSSPPAVNSPYYPHFPPPTNATATHPSNAVVDTLHQPGVFSPASRASSLLHSEATRKRKKELRYPRHSSRFGSKPHSDLSFFSRSSKVFFDTLFSCIYSASKLIGKLALVFFSLYLFSVCLKAVCCLSFSVSPFLLSLGGVIRESNSKTTVNGRPSVPFIPRIIPWDQLWVEVHQWWTEVYRCQRTF